MLSAGLSEEETQRVAKSLLTMKDKSFKDWADKKSSNLNFVYSNPDTKERYENIQDKEATGVSSVTAAESAATIRNSTKEQSTNFLLSLDDDAFQEALNVSPKARSITSEDVALSRRARNLGSPVSVRTEPQVNSLDEMEQIQDEVFTGNLAVDAENFSKYSAESLEKYSPGDPYLSKVISSPEFAEARSRMAGQSARRSGEFSRVTRSPSNRAPTATQRELSRSPSPVRTSTKRQSIIPVDQKTNATEMSYRSPSKSPAQSSVPFSSKVNGLNSILKPQSVNVTPLAKSLSINVTKSPNMSAGDIVKANDGTVFHASGYRTDRGDIVQNSKGEEFVVVPSNRPDSPVRNHVSHTKSKSYRTATRDIVPYIVNDSDDGDDSDNSESDDGNDGNHEIVHSVCKIERIKPSRRVQWK